MKKSLAFICAALMLSAAAAGAQEVSDWAGNARYEAANAQVTVAPRAVFMGDSITDNWGNFSHPEFFSEHNFAARGISGQTTCQMVLRMRRDVLNLKPRYVVILAGTNDLAENLGPVSNEIILENIQTMCEIARAHKIKPIICSVLPAYRYGWRPDIDAAGRIAAFNVLLKDYALKARIPYVDYYSLMADSRGGLPENLAPDGVHPSAEGYAIMEAEILKYIK